MKREIKFNDGFHGELILDDTSVRIGKEAMEARPYDLLYGALASCLYATFLDIVEKKRTKIDSCTILVDGEKRTEVPTTLEKVHITATVKGAEKQEAILRSFELATKYCSIYQTISHVAEMSWEVQFID